MLKHFFILEFRHGSLVAALISDRGIASVELTGCRQHVLVQCKRLVVRWPIYFAPIFKSKVLKVEDAPSYHPKRLNKIVPAWRSTTTST